MKDLQGLDAVRLRAARGAVRAWFEKRFTVAAVARVRELCATGDLRRARLALERAAPARAVREARRRPRRAGAATRRGRGARAATALRALQTKLAAREERVDDVQRSQRL